MSVNPKLAEDIVEIRQAYNYDWAFQIRGENNTE